MLFLNAFTDSPPQHYILKEWKQDGVVCRIVRYQVGVFKRAPSRVAAFYAFPKGATTLPAILEMHGGGQSASLNSVVTYAKRGYAGISINWGGNKMSLGQEIWSGPQTDWGKLDATHPPQRNNANHFAGSLTPDEYTLDTVESSRNSNWFVVLMAARRALTFLEQQPELDAMRIGAHGHSMGGKLTTDLAGIDRRIRATVPSCGGSGDLLASEIEVPGGSRSKLTSVELACVSDNAYTGKKSDSWFFMVRMQRAGGPAMEKWKTRPVGGEIRPEVWDGLWNDTPTTPTGQAFAACVEQTHATWLMDSSITRKLDPQQRERSIAGARRLGYEFIVQSVEMTLNEQKSSLTIIASVANKGVAPFYYDWPIELAAMDAKGQLIATWQTDWKLTGMIPNDPARRWQTRIDLKAIPPGRHQFLVRVPNPMPGGKPLRFANRTQDQHLPGYLTLGQFEQ